jgi:hypothetical protein
MRGLVHAEDRSRSLVQWDFCAQQGLEVRGFLNFTWLLLGSVRKYLPNAPIFPV